jgi:uncharacterized SAM-binding protein YcdF (DUF218 family)
LTPFAWLRWLRRLVVAVVLVCVLGVLWVAGRVWWVARQDHHPRSDAIVVLGASQYDGRPSAIFRSRLDHAKALYDEHVASRIVTVGGNQPGDRFTEASAGAAYLASRGVPRSALTAVGQGRDTLSSLRAVAAVFKRNGWRTAVLVTDPWHCLRSRTMARDQGIEAETSPTRSGPAVQSRSTEIRYITRETVAYVYYVLTHNDNQHYAGAV